MDLAGSSLLNNAVRDVIPLSGYLTQRSSSRMSLSVAAIEVLILIFNASLHDFELVVDGILVILNHLVFRNHLTLHEASHSLFVIRYTLFVNHI